MHSVFETRNLLEFFAAARLLGSLQDGNDMRGVLRGVLRGNMLFLSLLPKEYTI